MYDVAGNRIKGTSDALKVQDYTYNNANRLSTVKETSILVATYKYNALGQRVSKLLASQVQELYHYDEAGHLIAVTDASGNTTREYIYSGNELLGFVNGSSTAIPTTTITATTNQATLQNAVLSKTYSGYSGTAGYIQFNGEGQASWPVTIAATANHTIQISYALASGTRAMDLYVDGTKKTTVSFASTTASTKWTAVSLTLNLTAGNHTLVLKTTGASGPNLDRIRLTPVAGQTTGTASLYYVHNDHKSTPQVVTAQNQSVVWMADYQPFGKLQVNQSNSIELYSRFPGQYVDNESGLYYNYFRDYDPSIGRYIESDPIGLNGGINTYAYVEVNPFSGIDPLGLALGTIECDGSGGYRVKTRSDVPSSWQKCVNEHEEQDIEDWKKRYGLDSCEGKPAGYLPNESKNKDYNDYNDFKRDSECRANEVESKCINENYNKCDKSVEELLDIMRRQNKTNSCGSYNSWR